MAEFTNTALQTVEAGQNVLFNAVPVYAGGSILHRAGSGIVTLRGITNQCRSRFRVSFGANVAIPAGGTIDQISIALSLQGEALNGATAIVTPAAAEDFFNVYVSAFVEVPRGCCLPLSVENTGAAAIDVVNPNLIVERVA